jgi:hypothetical protein
VTGRTLLAFSSGARIWPMLLRSNHLASIVNSIQRTLYDPVINSTTMRTDDIDFVVGFGLV